MSSFKLRRLTLLALLAAPVVLTGCQVTPLYASRPGPDNALDGAIYIEEVDERVAQELRNELIFLFNGGQTQPTDPRYRLELEVEEQTVAILRDPDTGEATGQNLQVLARYQLLDAATGVRLLADAQRITTTYDRFEQGFADLRAERDAQNRAARELAERIRAALALELN